MQYIYWKDGNITHCKAFRVCHKAEIQRDKEGVINPETNLEYLGKAS